MRLAHWSRALRDVEFDPVKGEGRVVRLAGPRPESAPLAGFAAPERRLFGRVDWFAVYRQDDAVHFQAGPSRWLAADPSVSFHHARRLPFVSEFEVRLDGRRVYSLRYAHIGRLLFALVDPTYDGIDQDADFFLEFAADNLGEASWRGSVLERWTDVDAL